MIAAHTHTGKCGRKKLDAALPRVEVLHDLPEHQKHCAEHGVTLVRFGQQSSEQLDYQPARLRVIRHIRPRTAARAASR